MSCMFLLFLQNQGRIKPLTEYFYKSHLFLVVESTPNFRDLATADLRLSNAENFSGTANALRNNRQVLLLPGKSFRVQSVAKTESPYYHLLLKFAFSSGKVVD